MIFKLVNWDSSLFSRRLNLLFYRCFWTWLNLLLQYTVILPHYRIEELIWFRRKFVLKYCDKPKSLRDCLLSQETSFNIQFHLRKILSKKSLWIFSVQFSPDG